MIAVALALIAAAQSGAVAAIRAARAHNNAAIAAHDTVAIRADYADAYTVIRGTSGQVTPGADAAAGEFASDFAAPGFVAYVRTPDRITVANRGARAMERGHWVGTWHHPDARRAGEYLAVWVPVVGGWKLRSESFVTLAETGDVPQKK